jgi:hypothetical protein
MSRNILIGFMDILIAIGMLHLSYRLVGDYRRLFEWPWRALVAISIPTVGAALVILHFGLFRMDMAPLWLNETGIVTLTTRSLMIASLLYVNQRVATGKLLTDEDRQRVIESAMRRSDDQS